MPQEGRTFDASSSFFSTAESLHGRRPSDADSQAFGSVSSSVREGEAIGAFSDDDSVRSSVSLDGQEVLRSDGGDNRNLASDSKRRFHFKKKQFGPYSHLIPQGSVHYCSQFVKEAQAAKLKPAISLGFWPAEQGEVLPSIDVLEERPSARWSVPKGIAGAALSEEEEEAAGLTGLSSWTILKDAQGDSGPLARWKSARGKVLEWQRSRAQAQLIAGQVVKVDRVPMRTFTRREPSDSSGDEFERGCSTKFKRKGVLWRKAKRAVMFLCPGSGQKGKH